MYAGRASELFGVIATSEGEGVLESDAGAEMTLITDKAARASRWELYGVQYQTPLTFDVAFTSQQPLDRYALNALEGWLLGQTTYQKLLIEQDDMRNTYYNCVFTKATNYFYNNDPHSIRCTAVCDAPWAWEFPRKWSPPRYNSGGSFTDRFYNKSADSTPMVPTVEFTLADDSQSFSIVNHSMNGLTFGFSGLLGGERVRIDPAGNISSSTGMLRADRFNKYFLRLRQGINDLEFVGKVKSVELTYHNAKKVGA